jgi:apolipoprotein N-acyltransferase
VDLDGTLIKTDLLWESLAILLRRNPFRLVSILFWWTRGRAFLKQKLAGLVQVDAATLPYNEPFLAFLRTEKHNGRALILVTASDRNMARPVFNHVGLFDELLASDGKINLRGPAKLKRLNERFGPRGFDYAGNSPVDLPVWAGARQAIVVNANRELVQRAAQQTTVGRTFIDGYSPLFQLRRVFHVLLVESRYLYAIFGGLLLTAAFPKIGIAGLAWVAPAFMLAAGHGKTGTDTFRIGYVAGLAHFLSSLAWLLRIPVAGYPVLGWTALCAYLALYPAVWLWMVCRTPGSGGPWSRRTLWALTGAAIWVALEMIRARLLGGFPWNLVGASQFRLTPLIQIASFTGVYGVSFLVVWTSLSLLSALFVLLRHPEKRFSWQSEVILPLAVLTAVLLFGMTRLREQNPDAPTLRVTFVQPSIPQTMIWNEGESARRFAHLIETSGQALTSNTDLLLWPESAVPGMIRYDDETKQAISTLAQSNRVWIILASDDAEPARNPQESDDADYFNASFLISPDGILAARFCKQKLVMFGEYIPLADWLPFVKWFTPVTGGYTPGDRFVPFEFELERRALPPRSSNEGSQAADAAFDAPTRVKTSTSICFEDVFPHVIRKCVEKDTDFLLNLTSDAWFGEGAAQWQHAAAAVFRAVENGLPLLRSCNNGLTCWVDARGRLRQIFRDETGSVYGPGVMIAEIPLLVPGQERATTSYSKNGDWFGWTCVGIAFAAALAKTRRKTATCANS